MRRYLLVVVAACTIPDKEPSDDGLGGGSSMPTGPIDTRITQAPAMFSKDEVARFEFTSNLAAAKFVCRIDDKQPVDCTSPFSKKLDDGSHRFSVRANDGNGTSDDSPAEHLWTIDTVAPKTTLTVAPPATDNSTMVTFEFSANEDNVTFECSLDGRAFATCRSGDSFGPLADGDHTFAVRAKDRAGNVDASPAKHSWDVDTTMPDTTLLSGPPNASPSRLATFTFTSPDAGAGAIFECALDNDPFFFCTSPRTYFALREGDHTFQVRVRDGVGNVDPTPATDTWRVDLTPPRTMITSGPSGSIAATSASFTFTSNEADVTYACSLDGAAFAPCTSPYNATGLAEGNHGFAVRATDAATHDDPSPATASWTVDMIAPSIQIGAPGEGSTIGPRVTLMFTTNEGTTECSVDSGPFTACTSPAAYNLRSGTHSFSVRGTDGAGNTATATRSSIVACAPSDPTGADGLLHFDNWTQLQPSATLGPMATLGLVDVLEPVDPLPTSGRFGSGLLFDPNEGDLVSWPLALGAVSDLTAELWVRPDALDGTRDVLVSGDRRFAVYVSQVTATTVAFSVTVSAGLDRYTVTSPPVPAGEWHWVLVTVNEPRLRLRVDGTTTTTTDIRLTPRLRIDDLRLGGNFGGALDEVYVGQTAFMTDDVALARYCPL